MVVLLFLGMVLLPCRLPAQPPAGSPPAGNPSAGNSSAGNSSTILFHVDGGAQRLEMTVNSSRILALDQKIPQAQVSNPDLLDVTPLSPTQVQISARKPGLTQVNLWGEDKKIYTVDVMIFGDARELAMLLRTQFPKTSLTVIPVNGNVLISGYVDQPEHITRIVRIAEEFYPKVINNMTVSSGQQVLLHVKVMEVSRTKLRQLGFDFAKMTNGAAMLTTSIAGLITPNATTSGITPVPTSGTQTASFLINSGNSAFFGVLQAMRQNNLLKVLSEPTLVAVSGRPSSFHAGGEFTIIPQGLAAAPPMTIKYGTTVDFVPVILGNGRIRLEVRPEVSELDNTVSVGGVPGLRTRSVETGVEMNAGQTLAIGGLVESRIEAQNQGLPWIGDVPYVGAAFRTVNQQTNEIELLIMVTPELAEALDAGQVPPTGPGLNTRDPSDCELYFGGHLEVPVCGGAPSRELRPGAVPGPRGQCASPESAAAAETGATAAPGPQNRPNPPKAQSSPASSPSSASSREPTFIGPVGYDVVN
jgi:pilus assembly protein CpaC